MVDLKKVFSKEEKKTVLVNIRISQSERDKLQKLADEYTGGNVTKYMTKCCIEVVPQLYKRKN